MIRIFLGSSAERLAIAQDVKALLDEEQGFETDLWKHDVFAPSNYPLDGLLDRAKTSDFAAFILYPEDTVRKRGKQTRGVRDNVLFELGVFMGALGRKRCFALVPKGSAPGLPTDLDGLHFIEFDQSTADRSLNALASPSHKVAKLARSIGPKERHGFEYLAERGKLAKMYIDLSRQSKSIDIVALTLSCFVDNYQPHDLVDWMTREDAKHVRILVLDPNSCSAALRSRQEGISLKAKTLNALGQLRTSFLDRLRRDHSSIRGRFEVRVYDEIPYMGYFKADKELIYGFNYPYLLGQQSDCLHLSAGGSDAQLYKNMTGAFEYLWGRAAGAAVCVVSPKKIGMNLKKLLGQSLPGTCPLGTWVEPMSASAQR